MNKDNLELGCVVVFIIGAFVYSVVEAVLYIRALWNLGGI